MIPNPKEDSSIEERLEWWANYSNDTGLSSETIACALGHLTWEELINRPNSFRDQGWVPLDADDFGRCYRLLELIPEWKSMLPQVAEEHPNTAWPKLVENWDELTELFLTKEEEPEHRRPSLQNPTLYKKLKELGA